MLPMLQSSNSSAPLLITSDEASWITSFLLLGNIPGCILAAFIVDWCGRKTTLLIANIPQLMGYILIIVAWNSYILYAARLISGIGQGMVYVTCPMYIGEIADKDIRGCLGSLIKLMVTFGELYAHAIGPFVSYKMLGYYNLILPVLFFFFFTSMPESPYFLLMMRRNDDAMKNLKRLKGGISKDQLEMEMDQVKKTVINDLSNRGHLSDLFKTRGNRRAVFISCGLQFVLQFSGIAAIESYTQEILEKGDAFLPASVSVILMSVLQLIAGIGATLLVDKLGRRPLLLSTTFLGGSALMIAGAFCFLKFKLGTNTTGYGWLLHTSVIFYELIIALGLNPLPYMMLGELFPTSIKGAAVSVANILASFLAFFVSKMYQVIADYSGVYTSFGWFAASCFLGLIFIALYVPETKGKSLLEIQEELNCKKKKKTSEKKNVELQISTIA